MNGALGEVLPRTVPIVFVAEGSLTNSAFQDVPEVVWPGNVMLKATTSNVNSGTT